jgi:hypothetical protein
MPHSVADKPQETNNCITLHFTHLNVELHVPDILSNESK